MIRDPFNCPDCGVLIKQPWWNQKYCADCAAKRQKEYNRQRSREYHQTHKRPPAKKKAEPEKKPAPRKKRSSPWDLSGKSGTQVEIEARALGLSYGRYVALIDCGMIDKHCHDIGVDGKKVINKAWKTFEKVQGTLRRNN